MLTPGTSSIATQPCPSHEPASSASTMPGCLSRTHGLRLAREALHRLSGELGRLIVTVERFELQGHPAAVSVVAPCKHATTVAEPLDQVERAEQRRQLDALVDRWPMLGRFGGARGIPWPLRSNDPIATRSAGHRDRRTTHQCCRLRRASARTTFARQRSGTQRCRRAFSAFAPWLQQMQGHDNRPNTSAGAVLRCGACDEFEETPWIPWHGSRLRSSP
jgi:hypothetical protein